MHRRRRVVERHRFGVVFADGLGGPTVTLAEVDVSDPRDMREVDRPARSRGTGDADVLALDLDRVVEPVDVGGAGAAGKDVYGSQSGAKSRRWAAPSRRSRRDRVVGQLKVLPFWPTARRSPSGSRTWPSRARVDRLIKVQAER